MDEKLLILDLDETLMHAVENPLEHKQDFVVSQYYVYKRPHVENFLNFCRDEFTVAVWTSSTEYYAKAMCDELFGNNYPLKFIWSRDRCILEIDPFSDSYNFIKDLKKVKKLGYGLEQIIVVDDTPEKLMRQYKNLVRISPFKGDREDNELVLLMSYLSELKQIDDVRNAEKRGWRQGTI